MSQADDRRPTEMAPAPEPEIDPDSRYEIVDGLRRWRSRRWGTSRSLVAARSSPRSARGVSSGANQARPGHPRDAISRSFRKASPQRCPDIAFVSYARWASRSQGRSRGTGWDVVPELAIEVVSPSNKADEVVKQDPASISRPDVLRVWIVYPSVRPDGLRLRVAQGGGIVLGDQATTSTAATSCPASGSAWPSCSKTARRPEPHPASGRVGVDPEEVEVVADPLDGLSQSPASRVYSGGSSPSGRGRARCRPGAGQPRWRRAGPGSGSASTSIGRPIRRGDHPDQLADRQVVPPADVDHPADGGVAPGDGEEAGGGVLDVGQVASRVEAAELHHSGGSRPG